MTVPKFWILWILFLFVMLLKKQHFPFYGGFREEKADLTGSTHPQRRYQHSAHHWSLESWPLSGSFWWLPFEALHQGKGRPVREHKDNWIILVKTEDCGQEDSVTQVTAFKCPSQGHGSLECLQTRDFCAQQHLWNARTPGSLLELS